jgi:phage N-6-adenine-methyltransferase
VRKLSTVSVLGSGLQTYRKARGLTQGQLATRVGLTEKTVRLLEHGRGNLDSWRAVLKDLGLELVGRNLPAGPSLGARLAALRRHRRLSQRDLAALLGVTQPTLVALERRDAGRLTTLERVLETLGAGAYLAPLGQARAFFTHAGNASTNQEWETPTALLEALGAVFGRFDLDPCAPRKSRARVKARVHWTEEDDGLALPWHGTVFVNPPYGRTLARWVAKAYREVREGRAKMVVALLPARPDTTSWHDHIAGRAVVYFLRGRLKFGTGTQSAPFPSALVVWGAAPEVLPKLDAVLKGAWRAR